MIALRDGQAPLVFYADAGRTAEGLRSLSAKDADAYPRYDQHVRALSGFLARLNRRRRRGSTGRRRATWWAVSGWARRFGIWAPRDGPRADPGPAHGGRPTSSASGSSPMPSGAPWLPGGRCATAMGPWSAGTALVLLNDMAEGDGGPAGETAPSAVARRHWPGRCGGPPKQRARRSGPARPWPRSCRRTAPSWAWSWRRASGSRRRRWRPRSIPAPPCSTWLDPMAAGPRLRWRAGNIRAAGHVAVVELELSAPPAFDGVDDPGCWPAGSSSPAASTSSSGRSTHPSTAAPASGRRSRP